LRIADLSEGKLSLQGYGTANHLAICKTLVSSYNSQCPRVWAQEEDGAEEMSFPSLGRLLEQVNKSTFAEENGILAVKSGF